MSFTAMVQIFLAVTFALSSALKMADRKAFEEVLGVLFTSTRLTKAGAWLVPIAELLGGVLLLVNGWEPVGLLLLLSLMVGFGWAHWSVLSQRKRVACNCFGSLIADTFGWRSGTRVLFLLAFVIYLLVSGASNLYEFSFAEWLSAAFMSVGILFVYALVTTTFSQAPSPFKTESGMKS